ncbi:MAG: LytR family transcriptional regulator [Firmicutes bacterium]|nr:LytR family transcriptional regulator [Bacillota bacterium]
MKRLFTKLALCLLLVGFVVTSVLYLGYAQNNGQHSSANITKLDSKETESLQPTTKPTIDAESSTNLNKSMNILMVGLDKHGSPDGPARPGPYRSDVILLLRVNPDRQQVECLSIPRDTRAEVPGHNMTKIAHAHVYGGMPLTIESVEKLLGIKVDHFLRLDYTVFARIVDILGGIEIEVPQEMEGKYYHFAKGKQTMTSQQAYYYILDRNCPNGDIGRIERQQQFLRALLQEVRQQVGPLDLASIYMELRRHSNTSLSLGDIIKLGLLARKVDLGDLQLQTLAGTPKYIEGLSYWIPDSNAIKQIQEQFATTH